jgi:hypothetical protein
MDSHDHVTRLIGEGRFFIDERHIVEERPWRGILVPHVLLVLRSGVLHACEDHEAHWRGKDQDGRLLELALRPFDEDFKSLPTWAHSEWVGIKTAYVPDGKGSDLKRKLKFEKAVSKRKPRRKS